MLLYSSTERDKGVLIKFEICILYARKRHAYHCDSMDSMAWSFASSALVIGRTKFQASGS